VRAGDAVVAARRAGARTRGDAAVAGLAGVEHAVTAARRAVVIVGRRAAVGAAAVSVGAGRDRGDLAGRITGRRRADEDAWVTRVGRGAAGRAARAVAGLAGLENAVAAGGRAVVVVRRVCAERTAGVAVRGERDRLDDA